MPLRTLAPVPRFLARWNSTAMSAEESKNPQHSKTEFRISSDAAAIQVAAPPERREDTPIKLVFTAEDIASARSRAAELGGTMNAVDREWELEGAKVCDGCDPEGNVFQIRQAG